MEEVNERKKQCKQKKKRRTNVYSTFIAVKVSVHTQCLEISGIFGF